jgi:hypothetical protein
MPSRPIPGSTGEVLTCLPSPYPAPPGHGAALPPRFIAKIRYVRDHGELPKSYAKNYKRGLDRFLCMHLGVEPSAVEDALRPCTTEEETDARLREILPPDVRAAKWNRELVQKGLTESGREFIAQALREMGCEDRIGEIKTVPDLIDFDEGRIE